MKQLIYDNRLGSSTNSFEYDDSKKVGWVITKGIFFSSISLEINKKVMEFATQNPLRAVIFDASEMQGTFSKITGFFKDEYMPHMEANGCEFISVVFSGNMVSIFAMQQLLKILKTKIKVKIVKTLLEAENWVSESI